MTVDDIKDEFKANAFLKNIYDKLRQMHDGNEFDMKTLAEIKPNKSDDVAVRYNLVLPTMRKSKVYGGISTALKIFNQIVNEQDADGRIIVVSNEKYSHKWTHNNEKYIHSTNAKYTLFFRKDGTLDVRENDVFIYTSWQTSYIISSVVEWQRKIFSLRNRKSLYLIQDYEPAFYPWSSQYALAESTYTNNSDSIVALFNSEQLYTFFKNRGYDFSHEYFFNPTMNSQLINQLKKNDDLDRKKQILIYGRPYTYRNAYEILKEALNIWSAEYSKAEEWTIISLGDSYKNEKLMKNTIDFKGKVSLEEYSQYMKESYVGISLMVSPHPSYPPLEMSTFGVRTITNTFENKNIESFNDNIISMSTYTPRTLAQELIKVCDEYETIKGVPIYSGDYIDGVGFSTVVSKVGEVLDEMCKKH